MLYMYMHVYTCTCKHNNYNACYTVHVPCTHVHDILTLAHAPTIITARPRSCVCVCVCVCVCKKKDIYNCHSRECSWLRKVVNSLSNPENIHVLNSNSEKRTCSYICPRLHTYTLISSHRGLIFGQWTN